MPTDTVDGQRVTWYKGPLQRIRPVQSFSYETQRFQLIVRQQMITVRGECWPDGRQVFTRRYAKPQTDPQLAERDEGAEQLRQRIMDSAEHAMSQREKLRAALTSDSSTAFQRACPLAGRAEDF